jgi:tyrosyl-tRNA synthetase
MSKSLGNYIGVTEAADAIFAKTMSISDELMWKYYVLLTDLTPAEIETERGRGQPMVSKLGLARRLTADFHDPSAAERAEAEWRRVHQARQAPAEMPRVPLAAGRHKPHELLVRSGLAKSNSEAARLLRQGAVRRDGSTLAPGALVLVNGESFVLSVGPARFVRFEVASGAPDDRP